MSMYDHPWGRADLWRGRGAGLPPEAVAQHAPPGWIPNGVVGHQHFADCFDEDQGELVECHVCIDAVAAMSPAEVSEVFNKRWTRTRLDITRAARIRERERNRQLDLDERQRRYRDAQFRMRMRADIARRAGPALARPDDERPALEPMRGTQERQLKGYPRWGYE